MVSLLLQSGFKSWVVVHIFWPKKKFKTRSFWSQLRDLGRFLGYTCNRELVFLFLKPLKIWYHLENFYLHYSLWKNPTTQKSAKIALSCGQDDLVLLNGWYVSWIFTTLFTLKKKYICSFLFSSVRITVVRGARRRRRRFLIRKRGQ